jgi:hypothetical protein
MRIVWKKFLTKKAAPYGHTANKQDRTAMPFKANLSTPDAYNFAANSALEIATRITSLPVALGLVRHSGIRRGFCAQSTGMLSHGHSVVLKRLRG